MNVELIFNHIQHHAKFSGYDQLARFVHARPYRPGPAFHLARFLPRSWIGRIPATHTPWYWGDAVYRELDICARVLLPRRSLFHFFYAENDLRLASRFPIRGNNRIVATFHQPPEFLDRHVLDKSYISGLDGAIVVAKSQLPYFEKFLPRDRIFHVPHGIDTEYWHPQPENPRWKEPTFLVVGFWLRDLDLIANTARELWALRSRARIRIIAPPEERNRFEGLANVQVLCAVSDDDLRMEYQRAHALFLPLINATANNAVLEAMASGTGVVTTKTGGVPEYVAEECALLIEPGDVAGAVASIESIAANSGKLVERMGSAARRRAGRYSWASVGRLMNGVYSRLLGEG